jgi:hypothetical protein
VIIAAAALRFRRLLSGGEEKRQGPAAHRRADTSAINGAPAGDTVRAPASNVKKKNDGLANFPL